MLTGIMRDSLAFEPLRDRLLPFGRGNVTKLAIAYFFATNRHIESRNRATVLSLISMLSGLYVALVGLLIGCIGDVSLTWAFLFMGVIVLVGSLLFRVR